MKNCIFVDGACQIFALELKQRTLMGDETIIYQDLLNTMKHFFLQEHLDEMVEHLKISKTLADSSYEPRKRFGCFTSTQNK